MKKQFVLACVLLSGFWSSVACAAEPANPLAGEQLFNTNKVLKFELTIQPDDFKKQTMVRTLLCACGPPE